MYLHPLHYYGLWVTYLIEHRVTYLIEHRVTYLIEHRVSYLSNKTQSYLSNKTQSYLSNKTQGYLSNKTQSYLSNTMQRVFINGSLSHANSVECSVPQGSLPEIFVSSDFTNDLPLILNKSLCVYVC
jgi:hypothetical protein